MQGREVDDRTHALTVFEQAILAVEPATEPWTVQIEAACGGRLEPGRLGRAVALACSRHPAAGARLRRSGGHARSYWWAAGGGLDSDPLIVVDCPDEDALQCLRAALYSAPVDLERAPALRVVLARCPGGDTVLVSASHVALDGIGALRLLRGIGCAYRGAPDPVSQDAETHARAREAKLRSGAWQHRAREAARRLGEAMRAPARVAGDGRCPVGGYGIAARSLGADRTRLLLESRPPGASLNDIAVTAAVLTVARWNADRGSERGRIAVTVPVNMRPREYFWELAGNYASFQTVSVNRRSRADPRSALAVVMAQTAPQRRRQRTEALIGLFALLRHAPTRAQRLIASRLAAGRFVDSIVLSNLGRLSDPPRFDDDTAAVWFSPPCPMPMGVGIGIATSAGTLRIVVRHSLQRLGPQAAEAFADLYLEHLQGWLPAGDT